LYLLLSVLNSISVLLRKSNMNKIPFAVVSFLAVQLGGAIWWGVQIDHKVKLVEENRRYIQEVVIPSYEISDNWDNPHYNNWLKAGGWKD